MKKLNWEKIIKENEAINATQPKREDKWTKWVKENDEELKNKPNRKRELRYVLD